MRENREKIDLIILDIALDYGDGNILNDLDGGIQFLKEIKEEEGFAKIPLLIHSIVSKDEIEEDSGINIDEEKYIDYLYRDCEDREFYERVEKMLKKKF